MVSVSTEAAASRVSPPIDIKQVALYYLHKQLGDKFTLGKFRFLPNQNVWWAMICYQSIGTHHSIGIGRIQLDAKTGQVTPLSRDEMQTICQKALLMDAKAHNELPIDIHGYVLKEYARKQADRYLWDHIGMHYRADDPVLLQGEPARWQVSILFKMYELGPFSLGVMQLDARTGDPVPLTETELETLKGAVCAIIGTQTPPTNAR